MAGDEKTRTQIENMMKCRNDLKTLKVDVFTDVSSSQAALSVSTVWFSDGFILPFHTDLYLNVLSPETL